MDGALMEIGPLRVNEDGSLYRNNGSWHKHANLLFVDQPVGTGLSVTDTNSYIHELPRMASDMMIFLDKYFEIFPERQNDDFYIAGESYAGQYIPYISRAILDRNLNKKSKYLELIDVKEPSTKGDLAKEASKKFREKFGLDDKQKRDDDNDDEKKKDEEKTKEKEIPAKKPFINLKAVLIGNGWIDPVSQYLTYLPFAYNSGLIKHGSSVAAVVEKKHRDCAKYLDEHPEQQYDLSVRECESILNSLLRELYLETKLPRDSDKACVNMYDIRLTDTYASCGMNWPPDLSAVTPYLRRKDVLMSLNVPPTKGWKECSGPVGHAFKARHSHPSISIIPSLISDGLQVVMFNGDQDLICNHLGNEKLIERIHWGSDALDEDDSESESAIDKVEAMRRHGGFHEDEKTEDWYMDGASAGTIRSGRNMTYIKIYNASHMVPFDVPLVSQGMLHQVMEIPGYEPKEQKIKALGEVAEQQEDQQKDEQKQNDGDKKDEEEGEKEGNVNAYYQAGAFILIIVIIVALFLAYFVWRNRTLTSQAMFNNSAHQRVRSVHYEDELDDYERNGNVSVDPTATTDRNNGFFASILSGITRWHKPASGSSSSNSKNYGGYSKVGRNGSTAHLTSVGEEDDEYDDNQIPLSSMNNSNNNNNQRRTTGSGTNLNEDGSMRDSIDSILDELNAETERNTGQKTFD